MMRRTLRLLYGSVGMLASVGAGIAQERTPGWIERVHFVPTGIERNDIRFGRQWWNMLAVSGEHAWLYLPSWREDVERWEDDTLRFLRFRLSTGVWDTVYGIAPGLSRWLVRPAPAFFDIRDSLLMLGFVGPDRSPELFVVQGIVGRDSLRGIRWRQVTFPEDPRRYEYARIVSGRAIVFGKCYRHNPAADSGNVGFLLLEWETLRSRARREVRGLRGMELTHFGPSRLIDARGEWIALVEPGTYTVVLYDTALRERYRIRRTPPQWRQIPLDTLRKYAQQGGVKQLIRAVEPYVYAGSRIEMVCFLDERHLLLRYTAPASTEGAMADERWGYDIWRLEEDTAVLVAADLDERAPAEGEIPTPQWPSLRWTLPVADFPWVVTLRADAPIDWVGKPSQEYWREREEYAREHEAEYVVEIARLRVPLR
ncbi:hypothetical protein HRbin21_01023 [bacterium HR21]|nr:hypothetical protein HRbin21_01023 [bacterium HR21]